MSISYKSIENKLFFLLGLFTSISLLQISIGTMSVSPFNAIMYIIFVFELLKGKLAVPDTNGVIYFVYLICITISTVINSSFVPSNWNTANFIAVFNSWILGFLLIFVNKNILRSVKKFFINGLKLNTWIQLTWGILQFIIYKVSGQALNEIFFEDTLHLQLSDATSNIYYGINRLTGLNWEPAYFGLALIIGYLLSNKLWKKLLFVVGVVLSASRTSLLTLIAVIIVQEIYKLVKFKEKKKTYFQKQEVMITFTILLVIIVGIILNFQEIINTFLSTAMRFQNFDLDPSSRVHSFYYQVLGNILFSKFSLAQFLFGIGPASSGYAYTLWYDLYPYLISNAWNIENGLADIIVGAGVLGTVLVYWWFINNLRIGKDNKVAFALIIGILVGAITYSYFVNWIWVVVMFISLPLKQQDDYVQFKERLKDE